MSRDGSSLKERTKTSNANPPKFFTGIPSDLVYTISVLESGVVTDLNSGNQISVTFEDVPQENVSRRMGTLRPGQ